MTEPDQTQLDKFKEAARELETDDDPERFKERLKEVAKHKPVARKPKENGPNQGGGAIKD